MDNLGIRMLQVRKSKHLTEEDVARITGYSVSTIYRYERDLYLPSLGYIVQFAKLCTVSIDYLVNGQ